MVLSCQSFKTNETKPKGLLFCHEDTLEYFTDKAMHMKRYY